MNGILAKFAKNVYFIDFLKRHFFQEKIIHLLLEPIPFWMRVELKYNAELHTVWVKMSGSTYYELFIIQFVTYV